MLRAMMFGMLLAATGAGHAAESTRQLRDDSGEAVNIGSAPCRIVSLAPGTTAMLFAAGAGHCMVGTIAHSKEPAEAERVPVIGDAETLDFEQLLALRPTVVVVAVDVVQRVRIDRIRALGIPVYQVHVTRLAQMPESLRRLGALAGTEAVATPKADELAAELAALGAEYRNRTPVRVLYQIWDRPIYTIGGRHVITDALELCGAVNVFADLKTAAPAVTREAAILRNPELILASAPPGAADDWLAEWRKFPALAAVRDGQLVSHADARIDRMGPSVIEATGQLCAVIDTARAAGVLRPQSPTK
jgi:iron complex transport system substrate-binding protein